MEDYSEHPKSLAEVKASREDDATLWSPRDLLISLLRDIDSGEISPNHMVIAYGEERDGRTTTFYRNSSSNMWAALGMLERVKFDIMGAAK